MGGVIAIEDLAAIYMRFDPSVEALNTRALAQLAAKLLYTRGPKVSLSASEIGTAIANVFDVPRLDVQVVEHALGFLKDNRLANVFQGRWRLSDNGFEKFDGDVKRAATRLSAVLRRHFSGQIEQAKLEAWFVDACVRFYGLYGAQWAAAIGRQKKRPVVSQTSVRSLLDAATQSAGLNVHADALFQGFYRFIGSGEQEDVEHQWSLSQSMLAARLVAAKLGPDPLTAASFRGVSVLLDTNVLIVAALESDNLAEPLRLLGSALAQLDASLGIIEPTRDEYRRVIHAKRIALVSIAEKLPRNLLEGTSDPFIETALERGCVDEADFDHFYDELLDPPTELVAGVAIEMLSSPSVVRFAEEGAVDETLKSSIQLQWTELRSRKPKGIRQTEHDASLTTVVEGLVKSGVPAVVLTLDRTMQAHSQKRSAPSDRPTWVSLDALIQVLAVDGLGPGIDPKGFAPLMSAIIKSQCEPALNTYTAEDLALMLDVEERCRTLPEPIVRDIAASVARARLAGARRDDNELRLTIRRAFTKGVADAHMVLGDELREKAAETRVLNRQLQERIESSMQQKAVFVPLKTDENRRRATSMLNRSVLLRGAASAALLLLSLPAAPFFSGLFTGASGVLDSGVTIGLMSVALWPLTRHFTVTRKSYLSMIATAEQDAEDDWASKERRLP